MKKNNLIFSLYFLFQFQVKFKVASCHCALSENRAALVEVPINTLSLMISFFKYFVLYKLFDHYGRFYSSLTFSFFANSLLDACTLNPPFSVFVCQIVVLMIGMHNRQEKFVVYLISRELSVSSICIDGQTSLGMP